MRVEAEPEAQAGIFGDPAPNTLVPAGVGRQLWAEWIGAEREVRFVFFLFFFPPVSFSGRARHKQAFILSIYLFIHLFIFRDGGREGGRSRVGIYLISHYAVCLNPQVMHN